MAAPIPWTLHYLKKSFNYLFFFHFLMHQHVSKGKWKMAPSYLFGFIIPSSPCGRVWFDSSCTTSEWPHRKKSPGSWNLFSRLLIHFTLICLEHVKFRTGGQTQRWFISKYSPFTWGYSQGLIFCPFLKGATCNFPPLKSSEHTWNPRWFRSRFKDTLWLTYFFLLRGRDFKDRFCHKLIIVLGCTRTQRPPMLTK